MTKADTLTLTPGDKVFCTVTAIRRWCTFREVRPRDGYIKVDEYNSWNPPHNFEREKPAWMR